MKDEKLNHSNGKINWKTVLIFVSIAFTSQCGGGFASGSTPWSYFFANTGFYGMLPKLIQPYFCLFMPFIVAFINCFIIYFFMKFAMDFRTFDYNQFLAKYGSTFWGGKLAKPMQIIYEFNFNWLLIVCMALAYSSSGSALSELTGIPYLATTFLVGIIMLLVCMKGSDLVRKNAVIMSTIIFISLLLVHIPNLIYYISNGDLTTQLQVMSTTINDSVAKGNGSYIKFLLVALCWAYIFSGQNLGGFGGYVNHAQIFNEKKTLKVAVILSVILNWFFLEITVFNLAANYSDILEYWNNGNAVYTIRVIQNGIGNEAVHTVLLTLLTISIFFATISTAINYSQGFNDRVLNWYQKKSNEDIEVSKARRNKRGMYLTLFYIVITWGVSQVGLTTLVSKGLTLVSYITIFTLIIPTIVNVIIGWKDREIN